MKTNVSRAMLNKDSLSKQILNQLRNDVIIGKYKKGTRVLETDLANAYGASRGTIRFALQELSNEGLAEFLESGGCVIVGIDEKTAHDSYQFRKMLETEAAEIILEKSNLIYTPMAEVLDQYSKRESDPSFQNNPFAYCIDLDLRFHQAFMEASENRPIYRAWCFLTPVIRTLLEINMTEEYYLQFTEKFYDHHKIILDYAILHDRRILDEISSQIKNGMEMSIKNLLKYQSKNS